MQAKYLVAWINAVGLTMDTAEIKQAEAQIIKIVADNLLS
jgi:hypothetical protein